MSRLDHEPDVVALARELGLRGNPVEAVVRFCEEKIGCWAAESGRMESVTALEQLVTDRLQLTFHDVCCSDDDLTRITAKYVAQCHQTAEAGSSSGQCEPRSPSS